MASSLGPIPSAKNIVASCITRIAKALIFSALILAMLIALIAALIASGDQSMEDNIIGKTQIPQIGEMQVGYQHDGDLSYNYYVRIVGGTNDYSDWTPFGSDLKASGPCKTASSADGRFTCIYAHHAIRCRVKFLSETMPLMVIHDRKTGMIWPTEKSDDHFPSFWLGAWRIIRHTHPDLPAITD